MKYLFILLSFWAMSACAQNKLDFGAIKADSHFSCNEPQGAIEIDCGLDKICNSKNELEIRVSAFYAPMPFFAIYVLTYSDSGWAAKKYEYNLAYKKYDTSHLIQIATLKSRQTIENIFDTLKLNNIFTLPDQDSLQHDLNIKSYVDDGSIYLVTFKVGNQFRKYDFDNPKIFHEKYREVKEFTYYLNIANVFYNAFDKH